MKNEITLLRNGQWKAFVFNAEAAKLINKRLKVYDAVELDEAIFTFNKSDLAFVRATLEKFGGIAMGAEVS